MFSTEFQTWSICKYILQQTRFHFVCVAHWIPVWLLHTSSLKPWERHLAFVYLKKFVYIPLVSIQHCLDLSTSAPRDCCGSKKQCTDHTIHSILCRYLQDNRITLLPVNAFDGLTSLQTLWVLILLSSSSNFARQIDCCHTKACSELWKSSQLNVLGAYKCAGTWATMRFHHSNKTYSRNSRPCKRCETFPHYFHKMCL